MPGLEPVPKHWATLVQNTLICYGFSWPSVLTVSQERNYGEEEYFRGSGLVEEHYTGIFMTRVQVLYLTQCFSFNYVIKINRRLCESIIFVLIFCPSWSCTIIYYIFRFINKLTPWLMETRGSMPHSQGISNNPCTEPNQFHYAKSSLTWVFSRSFSLPCAPFSMLNGPGATQRDRQELKSEVNLMI